MRLSCHLETVYLLATSAGGPRVPGKSSNSRASVCVGRKITGGKDELYLTISTARNVAGIKYKVQGNVTKLFSKFISEGKLTIRFKEPAHDVVISKADPTQLSELVAMLKVQPQRADGGTVPHLRAPKLKDIEQPKSKLVIKNRANYPMKGFPSSLQHLTAAGISLNRVDLRILDLKLLQTLDLSNNCIKAVPSGVGELHLVELRLAGNSIAALPSELCTGELAGSLKLLDLSRNSLTTLPQSLSQLKHLVTLKLDCNWLRTLPNAFGRLVSLKYLSVSANQVTVLPHTFPRLSLQSIDLFGNPFASPKLLRSCASLSLPSLLELSARAVKHCRLPYDPCCLPVRLCHYLDSAKKCLCGGACFSVFLHHLAKLDLHKIAATVTTVDRNGDTSVPVEVFLCSAKCLKLWTYNR